MNEYEIIKSVNNSIKTLKDLTGDLLKYKKLEDWLNKKQNKKEKVVNIQDIFFFLNKEEVNK